jgi:hypothetical protein
MARLRSRVGGAFYLGARTGNAPWRTDLVVVVSPQGTTVRVPAA